MKIQQKNLITAALAIILAITTSGVMVNPALAATPVVSLVTSGGNGDSVQITVNGDANAGITLYYNVNSTWGTQTRSLGNTNANGYFIATISTNSYGANPGSLAYVVINNQQSAMVTWPYNNSGNGPSLSQTSVTLSLGQTAVITSSSGSQLYIMTNSNSSVASFTINGTQITIAANSVGATTAAICYQTNPQSCTNVSVTVQSTSGQTLSFSQGNVNMTVGQNNSVNIYGGVSGNYYYISNNSNGNAVQASISGSTVNLYAANIGVATITVCQNGGGCGTLYTTVNNTGGGNSLSVSQNSITVGVGQSMTISIYGNGGYYLSNNPNGNVATISLSGANATIYGITNGYTNATICESNGGRCATLSITVGSGGGYNQNNLTFSPTNPTIAIGQTASVAIYGGSGSYYISSGTTGNLQATINGSTLSLYATVAGSWPITVCSYSNGCGTLYVTVGGNNTSYYPIYNQTDSPAALLSQIQVLENQLAQLRAILVSRTGTNQYQQYSYDPYGGYDYGYVAGISTYKFYNSLSLGSSGTDVVELQKRLAAEGFYGGAITGYFGTSTYSAVVQYQQTHGINPIGIVGPATRASLNSTSYGY